MRIYKGFYFCFVMAFIYIRSGLLNLVLSNKTRKGKSFRVKYVEVYYANIRSNHQLDFAEKRFTDRSIGHRDADSRFFGIVL